LGKSPEEISRQYGIKRYIVCQLYPKNTFTYSKLTKDDKQKVYEMLKNGKTIIDIAINFNVSFDTIKHYKYKLDIGNYIEKESF
jgi:DNA-binding NarL/FixJ family response regulator